MTTHKPAPDNPPAAPSAGPERQQPKFGTRVSLSSNAIAGVAAGFSSSVITHPLDVVKTRFQVRPRRRCHTEHYTAASAAWLTARSVCQVHDGIKTHVPKYRSTLHALVQIARSEGVVTLYAGLSPNLLGSTVSWGSYFYCYNLLRGLARREQHLLDSAGQLGPLVNLTCATCSGFLTCLATNPIWLVKTRLQLQQGRLASDATAHGVRCCPLTSRAAAAPCQCSHAH
jgi:solute carrier family 25 folate transporter 32